MNSVAQNFVGVCNLTSYEDKVLKAACGPYRGDQERAINVALCPKMESWLYRKQTIYESVMLSFDAMLLCGNTTSSLPIPLDRNPPEYTVGGPWLESCAPIAWDGDELTATCLTASRPSTGETWHLPSNTRTTTLQVLGHCSEQEIDGKLWFLVGNNKGSLACLEGKSLMKKALYYEHAKVPVQFACYTCDVPFICTT